MNKKKKQAALREAEKVVAALKAGGAISEGARVEVRVHGQRQKATKRQTKPR